ncbi:MAG: selenide, water dikinase SelD [Betaproteobacteria bacterium]|nr:MAG: selenide, water dikinase SelD [Betaproteobacteria bacterium]
MNAPEKIRLTEFSHGGGCGCKIAPAVLTEILASTPIRGLPKELLVGTETADDAAVYRLNDSQALVATTDFFTPIVDDPYDFGRIAATNALSDVYAMGARPIFALAIVGMPLEKLPVSVIRRILEGGQAVCAQGKPLGIGILSAALKKGKLSEEGYARMVEWTTRLNTPGEALAEMESVHALTDVTGFGLAGHLLEILRGSRLSGEVKFDALPVIPEALEWAKQGIATGASERNWKGYGHEVELPAGFPDWKKKLLTDPQTSGGLLVATSAEAQVLEIFKKQGFAARAIGRLSAGPARLTVT